MNFCNMGERSVRVGDIITASLDYPNGFVDLTVIDVTNDRIFCRREGSWPVLVFNKDGSAETSRECNVLPSEDCEYKTTEIFSVSRDGCIIVAPRSEERWHVYCSDARYRYVVRRWDNEFLDYIQLSTGFSFLADAKKMANELNEKEGR